MPRSQADRRQGGRELCGELGADAADRAGRAGRCVRLRRPRLDGLWRAEEGDQGRDPREPARQPARADRAEGVQDRRRRIGAGFDLAKLAGDGRIAIGDVRAVPAGKYAKAALEKLGAWRAAEPKLAMTENVRAALALVGRGEAALGIVYETDAKVEPKVKIVGMFPGRFASADHLSGRADRDCQTGGDAVSRLPALAGGEGRVREIRLHVPGPADVVTDAFATSRTAPTRMRMLRQSAAACSTSPPRNGSRSACRCASRWWRRSWRCRSASRSPGCWRASRSGARRCSTASCICRWCCRRS